MKYPYCCLLGFLLLNSLFACKTDADQKKLVSASQNNSVANVSKNKKTNVSPLDEKSRERLYGVWLSNYEPTAMQFFEDGSFRRYIPNTFSEQEQLDEEDLDNGTWTVENGSLSLRSSAGDKQKLRICWLDDKLIYFGNIEEEFDSTFGTKEEFAAVMGFSKIEE
jgi:hypothetical protein